MVIKDDGGGQNSLIAFPGKDRPGANVLAALIRQIRHCNRRIEERNKLSVFDPQDSVRGCHRVKQRNLPCRWAHKTGDDQMTFDYERAQST